MQTKRTYKNRAQATRRSGRSNRSLQQARQSVESNIACKAIGGPVFRPDFLDLNLTTKSGFLIPELGFDDKPFENKSQIIESWYETLKKHPKVKGLMVDENASLNDVLDLLKATTDKLFKGYDWKLKFDNDNEICDIYYYNNYDEIYMLDLPLAWIDRHKEPIIREVCLYMIKAISQKLRIDRIKGSYTYYELDEFNKKSDVIEYINEHCDDYEDIEANELYINYVKYTEGDPAKLEKELRNMNFSIKIYKERLELIKDSHKRIYNWLKLGLEILNEDFDLSDFDFDPDDIIDENNYGNQDSVKVPNCFWFPYSDKDTVYDKAMQFFDDEALNGGINPVYEYGYLKHNSSRTPVSYSKLEKLIRFFVRGNKINPLKRKKR